MVVSRRLGKFLAAAPLTLCPLGGAGAQGSHDWQINLPQAASPTMERIVDFHDLLLVLTTAITVLVMGLLLYVMFRFSERRNPVPSKTTHNTLIEVMWTVVPVILLIVVAVPSFKLLYFADRVEDAEMTLKAIGRQWYWSYEYPDNGNFTFDATMIPDGELAEGQMRLLETDNYVVLPVDTKIRLLVTASDVLHAFALPALGVRIDAVPGHLNETWVEITREGTYYGQCSEICGAGHSYMPIAINAVSREAFDRWVEEAKAKFARAGEPESGVRLARAGRAHFPEGE